MTSSDTTDYSTTTATTAAAAATTATTTTPTFSSYLTSISNQVQTITNVKDETNDNDPQQKQNQNQKQMINIIMGNEAGDADSIISSLALSYVKNHHATDKSTSLQTPLQTPLQIPLISIHKEDMALRRDVILLLQLAGIHAYNELLYLNNPTVLSIMNSKNNDKDDDNNKNNNCNNNNNNNDHDHDQDHDNNEKDSSITITLVDHNKIRSNLWQQFNQYVNEIYDHHQDEHCHLDSTSIRDIAFHDNNALVGSTCTLVTERLIQAMDDDDDDENDDNNNNNNNNNNDPNRNLNLNRNRNMKIDGGLGIALLGVILLDTMNMSPDAAKGTERDEKAIQYLIDYSDWSTLLTTARHNDSSNRSGSDAVADDDDDDVNVNANANAVTNNDAISDILNSSKNQNGNDGLIQPDRVKLYEYLRDSKFDPTFWQGMSARDALRIDYKRFETLSVLSSSDKDIDIDISQQPQPQQQQQQQHSFGLSSVLLDANNLLSKTNFYTTAIEYMKEVDIDLLGVLCMVIVNDTPQRELILIGNNKDDEVAGDADANVNANGTTTSTSTGIDKMTNYLLNDTDTAFLEMTLIEDNNNDIMDDGGIMKRFRQGNPKGSRKQVAPAMLSFFSKL